MLLYLNTIITLYALKDITVPTVIATVMCGNKAKVSNPLGVTRKSSIAD